MQYQFPDPSIPAADALAREKLPVNENDTRTERARDLSLHELFEAQVERTPDATAVRLENRQWSYRELNRRANQLAHYLRASGVGPEVLVGLCMERSQEMLVGLLGTLKAGGAYVPLDPAYPTDRRAFMIQDSRAPILLTQERLRESLSGEPARLVTLDENWAAIATQREDNPAVGAVADNLAYVIYTSGSTGRPKGVGITHRAICNHMRWLLSEFAFTARDRVLQKTSISFDASVHEICAPLLVGGQLVIAEPGGDRDSRYLVQLMAEHQITVLMLVPSLLRLLVQEPELENCRSLAKVFCGGEVLTAELQERFFARLPAELNNLYGPTEAAIDATFWRCRRSRDEARVPIGHPVANTQIYLLDERLQPVPPGAAGELYIGGECLARGYHGRPERTAERFIPDPFSREPGARLYRTGDLARCQPDGSVDYLGRLDDQVKVRGFRIELGEIEAALEQHPAVRNGVVTARPDTAGDPQLVAYVVPVPGQTLATDELRRFLKEKLPEYMVPSAFVMLASLPLTPSGKVNRRALPDPDRNRPELERAYVSPRGTLELQLTKIWEELLGVQPIGVRDDFFDLGGHSLLAVRLFARIEEAYGKRLPLVTLFHAPTIEQLARVLLPGGASTTWSSLVPIRPEGARPPLFCIQGVGGHVLCYRNLPRYLDPEQPIYGLYGLEAHGLRGTEGDLIRIEDMAARYIPEMRALQPNGPYYLAGYSLGGLIALEIAQQLRRQGEQVALLVLFDSDAPDHQHRSMLQTVSYHLGKLARLSPGEQLRYVRARAKGVRRRIENRIWQIAAKADSASVQPLPDNLRDAVMVNRQALAAYVPQVYPGRITLYQAGERPQRGYDDPLMGWGRLAAGGLEVFSVPGSHTTILEEPHVRVTAGQLESDLRRAQAESREAHRAEPLARSA